jgi:hypothetical protein
LGLERSRILQHCRDIALGTREESSTAPAALNRAIRPYALGSAALLVAMVARLLGTSSHPDGLWFDANLEMESERAGTSVAPVTHLPYQRYVHSCQNAPSHPAGNVPLRGLEVRRNR